MPKQVLSIPNEVLLAKLGDRQALSDHLLIVAAQLGVILSRSVSEIEEDRKAGRPPPFVPLGPKSIRYRLGTVRDYLDSLPECNNTTEARLAAKNGLLGFATFADWLDDATPSDEWPFLLRKKGGPVDFWKSLSMGDSLDGDEECAWLSLGEYLARRRDGAMAAEADSLGDAMETPDGPITPIKRP